MMKCKKKVCKKKIEQPLFDNLDNTLEDWDFSEVSGGFANSFSKIGRAKNKGLLDFSNLEGSFKKAFKKTDHKLHKEKKRKDKKAQIALEKEQNKPQPPKARKPLTQEFNVRENEWANIGGGEKQLERVFVPRDRELIIQGVDQLIMSEEPQCGALRSIGYYKGEKLKQLCFTFFNNSDIDFQFELFNPSMPLDYLYSTSLNLNDKISIAGGTIAYSDVLFNLLANPAMMVNAKFTFAAPAVGATLKDQINIPLIFKNKEITGLQKVKPLNVALEIDNMQYAQDIVFFDIMCNLNRPFIPDGMDVIQYTIKAGMTVTMAFYYKQHSLKRFFFEEAKNCKALL